VGTRADKRGGRSAGWLASCRRGLRVHSLVLLAGLAAANENGDDSCWEGTMNEHNCCYPAPDGSAQCWDGVEYTYERCCPKLVLGRPGAASPEVAGLAISPGSVKRLPLLGGGLGMPMVGMGLCCRPTASGQAVRQGVLDWLLLGGRLLDDAQLYSNHREVGEGLRQAVALGVPRSEIFFATKMVPEDFGFEHAGWWVDRALQEAQLDYIDLVLLHWAGSNDNSPCGSPRACRQETWMALQRAKAAGKIRHLGVSNFGKRQMEELNALGGAPIEVNQIEYHPWAPELHHDTAAWCHERGIAVTAYGSMGSAQMKDQMITQKTLQDMGAQKGKSAGQVLLRWAIQKNVSVIPGTSNPKHMAENLRIFDFDLDAQELAMLDQVPEEQRVLHFGHYPDQKP